MSNNRPNNGTNIFLRLFYAFIRTPRRKLLRGIDHSIVVFGFIYLVTLLFIAGTQLAIDDPLESQYQNIIVVSITIFIFIGAFAACEAITRFLITPYR